MPRGKKPSLAVDEFGQITKLSVIIQSFPLPGYQIAAMAGMPQPRLSEYSLGKKAIPIHHLIALSEVFELDPEDIVGTMPYESYVELFQEDVDTSDDIGV